MQHERPEPQNRIPRFRTLAVGASSADAHALRGPRLPPHFQCGTCAEATMVQFGGASRSRCHPGGCPIRWPCRIGPLGFPATVAHGATFRCFGCTAHTALIFTLPGTSRPHWCGLVFFPHPISTARMIRKSEQKKRLRTCERLLRVPNGSAHSNRATNATKRCFS